MYEYWRAIYLAQVMAYVYATSDSTTFMRYRGDGIQVIPDFPGC